MTCWGQVEIMLILSGSDQLGAGRDGSEKSSTTAPTAWWAAVKPAAFTSAKNKCLTHYVYNDNIHQAEERSNQNGKMLF